MTLWWLSWNYRLIRRENKPLLLSFWTNIFSFFNNLQMDNLDIFLFRISSSGFILARLLWDSRMIDMVSFQFDFNIVFVGRYDKNQWCGSGLIVSGSTKSDNTDPDPVLKPKNLILRYVITFLRKNFINLLIKFYSSLHFNPWIRIRNPNPQTQMNSDPSGSTPLLRMMIKYTAPVWTSWLIGLTEPEIKYPPIVNNSTL